MNLYDSQPVTETRIILETLRDHIFVDELEVEYNELFFSSLRYVFSEQLFVDWAFKSSFVKAQHNVGELSQKVVFRNDNLENYQDNIYVLNTRNILCDLYKESSCSMVKNNKILFRDETHLNLQGSDYFAKKIFELINSK
jgi:hypothetical protein